MSNRDVQIILNYAFPVRILCHHPHPDASLHSAYTVLILIQLFKFPSYPVLMLLVCLLSSLSLVQACQFMPPVPESLRPAQGSGIHRPRSTRIFSDYYMYHLVDRVAYICLVAAFVSSTITLSNENMSGVMWHYPSRQASI